MTIKFSGVFFSSLGFMNENKMPMFLFPFFWCVCSRVPKRKPWQVIIMKINERELKTAKGEKILSALL